MDRSQGTISLICCLVAMVAGGCLIVGCQQSTPIEAAVADGEIPPIVYRKDGIAEASFDSLEIPIEADEDYVESMMRDDIRKLDGKRIEILGYILGASVYQDRGIKEFVLIRDNQQCCFGPGAKIFHNMQVEMAEGKSTEFSTRPVRVSGEFSIRPWYAPDGKCYSIYHLMADEVSQNLRR